MIVRQTVVFQQWHEGLRDKRAARIIAERMLRVSHGLLGDSRSLGDGLSELKVDFGPGYRLYFTIQNGEVVWLLWGGDKGSQQRDIHKARALLENLEK